MKISDLIKKLTKLQEIHGDLEVFKEDAEYGTFNDFALRLEKVLLNEHDHQVPVDLDAYKQILKSIEDFDLALYEKSWDEDEDFQKYWSGDRQHYLNVLIENNEQNKKLVEQYIASRYSVVI